VCRIFGRPGEHTMNATAEDFRARRGSAPGPGRLYDRALQWAIDAGESVDELNAFLRTHLEDNPYATLVVAAGLGYFLGRGLPAGVTRMVGTLGSRLAMTVLASELAARFTNSPATPAGGNQQG